MVRPAGDRDLEVVVAGGGRGAREWLAVVVRGMAMGIAELVPGVSGGTIAFVTGIYEELIATLAGLQPSSLVVLRREGLRRFWVAHNLTFLLALGVGMVLAVVTFARVLEYLLDRVPPVVWAFFFGLIAASVVHIGRHRRAVDLAAYGLLGAVLAFAVLQLGVREGAAPLWMFFVGGVVAVSAWLLPAVSGSFLLLVLGLYEPVLRAFNAGEWLIPLILGLGCLVGLLAFSRFLHWLMSRRREPMLAALTGFMAVSLLRLWPWHHGDTLLSPAGYQAVTGLPPLVVPVLAAVMVGVLVLWLLSRLE
jgi:putative membrane protein